MFHKPSADLSANNLPNAQQNTGPIINIANLLWTKSTEIEMIKMGRKEVPTDFWDEYSTESKIGTIKKPPPSPLNYAPMPTRIPRIRIVSIFRGIGIICYCS